MGFDFWINHAQCADNHSSSSVDGHRLRNCADLRGWHALRRRRKVSAPVSASLRPRTALFIVARCELKKTAFTRIEGLLFGTILVATAAGLYSLATVTISIQSVVRYNRYSSSRRGRLQIQRRFPCLI